MSFDDSLKNANPDEKAVVRLLIEKMMGEGRREHGPLDVNQDSVLSDTRNAQDEITDGLFYVLKILLREAPVVPESTTERVLRATIGDRDAALRVAAATAVKLIAALQSAGLSVPKLTTEDLSLCAEPK